MAHIVELDDLPGMTGSEFVGEWFQVDREHHELFFRGTYLERVYDTTLSGYPEGMIEGFQLLGLLDYLTYQLMHPEDGPWYGYNYGLNRVRFVSPVTVHDRIRLRCKVAEVSTRNRGYLVRFSTVLEVEHRDRHGMTAEWLILALPRDGAEVAGAPMEDEPVLG